MAVPPPISRLIALLAKLPGIGEKSAQRLAFHILRAPSEYARELSDAIQGIRERVRLCTQCMNLTESDPCTLCEDPGRERGIICVVESVQNLLAIERTGEFRGLYHVLHGALSPLDGIGPDDIKIKELLVRLRDGQVSEVIMATNPDVEGEATSLYLSKLVRPLGPLVTRIAQGVPIGGSIEYTDQATLGRAISTRRPV